jgi:hypothetical protein
MFTIHKHYFKKFKIIKLFKMNKLLIFIITILILFVISNKIAKKYTQSSINERNFKKNISEIYGNENYMDYLEVIKFQSLPSKYSPFTEALETERYSKFLSVGRYSNRCNYNEVNLCKRIPQGGNNEIWVFGGSEIFGYGLKNDETITAHLEKLFSQEKVINFGQGFFYSSQNRILFQNLLTFLPPPKIVIFIEGFNDFKREHIFNNQFPGITSLTEEYKKLIKKKKSSKYLVFKVWANNRFNRLNIVKLYKESNQKEKTSNDIEIQNIDKKYSNLINRLKINLQINKSLEHEFKIKVINVLEPIALSIKDYSKSKVSDSELSKYEKNFFHYRNIYKLIDKNENLLSFVDLNLINLKIDNEMFIDLVHYSNKFTKAIALNLYKSIN